MLCVTTMCENGLKDLVYLLAAVIAFLGGIFYGVITEFNKYVKPKRKTGEVLRHSRHSIVQNQTHKLYKHSC